MARLQPAKTCAQQRWRRRRIVELTRSGDTAQVAELLHAYDLADQTLATAVRCRECGRRLTDDRSVERGIGPDCLAELVERARAEDFVRQHVAGGVARDGALRILNGSRR